MRGDDGNESPGATPLAPVSPPGGPVRIEMDLHFDADGRPSGAVWAGASGPQPVLGWLELMSELTRLLSDPGPPPPSPGGAP